MDWSKVVNFVSGAAPILGTVIGGPVGTGVGAIAGGAVSLIASAFGVEGEDAKDPEKIYAALQADPDAILKLKEIELTNKVELSKLALQSDQAYLADTQDARSAQVQREQATGKKDVNLYILAWTIVVGFFSMTGVLTFVTLPTDSTGVVFLLFGALVAGFAQVINYFFGSSKSSSDKTKMLNAKR